MEKINKSWFERRFGLKFLKPGDTVYRVETKDSIDFTKPTYVDKKNLYVIIDDKGSQV